MPISDTEYRDWLDDNAVIRCILVEIDANVADVETTFYLSSVPYFDKQSGQAYDALVMGNSIQVVERINLSGDGFISFGDIEIYNADGSNDPWLNHVWSNRKVAVYIGDVHWDKSDFRIIFNGVVEDIDSASNDVLNFKIRDKLQRINTPISETKLAGTTKNKNELIPLVFGEVHNITPLLTNPATLEYQVHDGLIEDIIEVRDNGVPVGFTKNLSQGKFTLTASPFGRITASVQGCKNPTWINTVSDVIEEITTNHGDVNNRLTLSDIDTAQFSAFNTANPYPIGIYTSKRENVLSICKAIALSVGARLVMSRTGQLRLIKIQFPPTGTPVDIGVHDMIDGSLKITEKIKVSPAVKIGFAKNWTVQDNLETGIPAEHKELLKQQWLTVTQEDVGIKTLHKIDAEPEIDETMLLTEADATIEATRSLNISKVPRTIYSFEATPTFVTLDLGDAVMLTHPRFNLGAGKMGIVIGLSTSWQTSRVNVEVLT